jgi:hypothetical protein
MAAMEHWLEFADRLGMCASVVFDPETHGPTTLYGGEDKPELRSLHDEVAAIEEGPERLLSEIEVVSVWSFGVALYALQNPTPENIDRALDLIGTSGDCEDVIDPDTLRPLPVPEPMGWVDQFASPEPPRQCRKRFEPTHTSREGDRG